MRQHISRDSFTCIVAPITHEKKRNRVARHVCYFRCVDWWPSGPKLPASGAPLRRAVTPHARSAVVDIACAFVPRKRVRRAEKVAPTSAVAFAQLFAAIFGRHLERNLCTCRRGEGLVAYAEAPARASSLRRTRAKSRYPPPEVDCTARRFHQPLSVYIVAPGATVQVHLRARVVFRASVAGLLPTGVHSFARCLQSSDLDSREAAVASDETAWLEE